MSRKVTMRLVRPLVLANFGDIKCEFNFIPYSHGDVEDYLKIWVDLIRAGGYTPSEEDISYFLSVIGFPESTPEKIIGTSSKQPTKESEKKPEKEKTKIEEETFERYYRGLTKYEKKLDIKTIESALNRAEEDIAKSLNSDAAVVYNGLVNQVRDGGFMNKFKPTKIDKIQAKNLKPMNVTLRNYYESLFKESLAMAKKEIFPQGDIKKFELDMLPEEFLELLKVEAFNNVGDYSFLVTKKTKQMVIQGMKDGLSEAGILKIIRDELKNTTETWVNTVARTKTTEIYNEARKRYWETDELAKQIVEAYQWSSIIDTRTSAVCRHLDGKIFMIGELSNIIKPPAHFNCRSLLVPITKFEDYEVSPKSDFNSEKLKKLGGGLMQPGK